MAKNSYKVGILATLTGAYSIPGIDLRDAAVLEADYINAAGGINGCPIELVIEDVSYDPALGVIKLEKLIHEDEVLAVIGPNSSAYVDSTRDVSEREQITHLLPHPCSAELRAKKLQWSFNLAPSDLVVIAEIINILKRKDYKKIAVFAHRTPVYLSMLEQLKAEAPKVGIQPIEEDILESTAEDATPQVLRLKKIMADEKPQAIVMINPPVTAIPLLKAMKEQGGIDLPKIGTHGLAAYFMLELTGDEANGVIIPGLKDLAPMSLPDGDPQKEVAIDFINRFKAKHGREPGMGILGADAINIISNALKSVGADRAKIREAVEGTKDFIGVGGIFNYGPHDHEGLTSASLAVYEIMDKKFKLISNDLGGEEI